MRNTKPDAVYEIEVIFYDGDYETLSSFSENYAKHASHYISKLNKVRHVNVYIKNNKKLFSYKRGEMEE